MASEFLSFGPPKGTIAAFESTKRRPVPLAALRSNYTSCRCTRKGGEDEVSLWPKGDAALHSAAGRQWTGLRRTLLAAGAAIETLEPSPDLPNLVFTANAAVVLDSMVVLARFRYRERQNEHPVFAAAFRAFHAPSNNASSLPLSTTSKPTFRTSVAL